MPSPSPRKSPKRRPAASPGKARPASSSSSPAKASPGKKGAAVTPVKLETKLAASSSTQPTTPPTRRLGPYLLVIGLIMLALAALRAQLPASSSASVSWLPASLLDAEAPLETRPPRSPFKPIIATKVVVQRSFAWLLARLPAQ